MNLMGVIYHIRKPLKTQRGNQFYKDRSDRGRGTLCGAAETSFDIPYSNPAPAWDKYAPCGKCIMARSQARSDNP